MTRTIIICSFLSILAGCNSNQTVEEKQKQLKTGKLDERNIYTVNEIGWSVPLPEGREIITRQEQYALNKRGEKLVEESLGVNVESEGLIPLVSIKKDQFNSFMSDMQTVDEAIAGSYDDRYVAATEMIKTAYKQNNTPAEFELGATKIDDIPFDRFVVKLYSPDKSKIILTQKMYCYNINGYDFFMLINYNNKDDEETLMKIIYSSKFSIKE